jgi:hypothetical protein
MLNVITDVRLYNNFYVLQLNDWCWFACFCVFRVNVGCCCVVRKMVLFSQILGAFASIKAYL